MVTATYDDLSTRTVPAEDYTLTGELAVGTSTITVLYGGQTATFTVVVTESALYPLADVAEVRAGSDVWVAVSDGNHIYGRTAANSRGPVILKDGHVAINPTTTYGAMFAVPAGATFTLNVKNFRYTGNTSTSNFITINFRNEIGTGSSSIVGGECRHELTATGDGTKNDFTATFTVESAQNAYSIYAFVYRAVEFEFDIELYVNGQRFV